MTGMQPKGSVAVAMIGARRHYAVPRALHAADLLHSFFTDLLLAPGSRSALVGFLPPPWRKRLLDRRADAIPPGKVRTFPLFAAQRLLRRGFARTPAARLRAYRAWNEAFGRLVGARWPEGADAFYAFNAAALEIFEQAKRRGMRTVLDQTAAPWAVEEALVNEERSRWPGWESEATAAGDWQPLAEREEQEWALGDTIVCGSDYVREAVRSRPGPADKCVVVPYGIVPGTTRPEPRRPHDGPLRVLFVGTLQLRKGIPYLLEAAESLRGAGIVFRAVGPARISGAALERLRRSMDVIGPLPVSAVRAEYDRADVLVLPSLSEGSANVSYEALAAGLPVVTTPNAGSVIRDGREGFVVPIRSAEDIAERLTTLAGDRNLITEMSRNAIARAGEFTWDRYVRRLAAAVTGTPRNQT